MISFTQTFLVQPNYVCEQRLLWVECCTFLRVTHCGPSFECRVVDGAYCALYEGGKQFRRRREHHLGHHHELFTGWGELNKKKDDIHRAYYKTAATVSVWHRGKMMKNAYDLAT